MRHFGKNKDDQCYQTIDQLTMQKLDKFRRMTIEIWDVIIALYKSDDDNNFDEFGSISDLVPFNDLPKQEQ